MVKLAPSIMVKLALRLRVVEHPSREYRRVPSWLFRSVRSSSQYGPDLRSNGWWNNHGNDRPFQDSTVT